MDEKNYNPSKSGEVRYSDNGGFSYFWPNDLPFDIELSQKTAKRMEKALICLSKLDGKVSQMTAEERNTLLIPFILMESTKSSAIEGTGTTMEDLYISERFEERDERKLEDNREVLNYRDALNYASSIEGNRIDEELLLKLHEILMKGVRGERKSPGRFRTTQVLVGSKGDTLETARFVPMPPEHIQWKIGNLIDYINGSEDAILKCAALSHYQFETIHPFTDGNGRMGRLLIMLILNNRGVLRHPVLYLSDYFNNYRDDYIRNLSGVRETDDFDSWIGMFLDALIQQSGRSIALIDQLFEYKRKLHAMTDDPKKLRLMDSLFVNPYVRNVDVSDICGVHISTATRIVSELVDDGILEEVTGKKRNQLFVCRRIMDLLNSY